MQMNKMACPHVNVLSPQIGDLFRIKTTNRQVNNKSMCIYVGGLIKGVVLGVT